jgi:hypothetical protein
MATISITSNDGKLSSASAVLEVSATNPEYNQPALRIKQAGQRAARRVEFPNDIAVYVTLAKVPDVVVAARWYPKPAGPSRFYTYACTPDGRITFSERKQP